jgi:DNA-binding transcriptional LysR family regulator
VNYTLHQLIVFERFSKLGSLSRTAEAMNLTEAAVSIQLRNFQNQFEIPIFERHGRNLRITEYGRLLETAVRKILEEHRRIQDVGQNYLQLQTGSLRIASASTGKYVLPYFLSEFAKVYPSLDLRFEVKERNEVVQGLENLEYDAALLSSLPDEVPCEALELLEDTVQLVVPNSAVYPDALESLSSLNAMNIIGRSPGSGIQRDTENALRSLSFVPNYRLILNSYEAVKQSILADLGVGFMPLVGLRRELERRELKVCSLPGFPLSVRWNLVWMKDRRKSPALESLIGHLSERRLELRQKKFDWLLNYGSGKDSSSIESIK